MSAATRGSKLPPMVAPALSGLARINYEAHLVQHGLTDIALQHPWLGTPLAVLGIAVLWLAWWAIYPCAVLATAVLWLASAAWMAASRILTR